MKIFKREKKLKKSPSRYAGIDRLQLKSPEKVSAIPESIGRPIKGGSKLVSLRHHPSLWVGVSLLLFFALFPWPYGYYILLRLVVFVVSVFIAYEQWKLDDAISGWVVAFGLIALLYNPLITVHLTRELWSVLNLATAMLFLWHFRGLKRLVAKLSGNNSLFSNRSTEEYSSFKHHSSNQDFPSK